MLRRFSTNFAIFSIFLDLLLVDLALFAAAELRSPLSILPFLQDVDYIPLPGILYLIFPLMWVGVMIVFAVYDGRKNLRVMDEFASLALGSMMAMISLAGVLYFSYRDVSRFLFLMAAGLAFLLMILWRSTARLIFRRKGLHSQVRRVLILGAGEIGRQIEDQVRRQPYMGLSLVGFLDDDPAKREKFSDVFGSLDQTRKMVQERNIDDVIISLPLAAHERLTQVVCQLQDLPVRVWVIPDYFALTLHRAQVDELANIPMLDLRAPALSEYQRMIKRGFDLVLTLLLLPFALPVMAVVALAIRLDSPGPLFYRPRRAGENSREFHMYKFRTMVVGADQMLAQVMCTDAGGNLVHKLPNDPRVTRVGRFLRHTSLDELPQLFNVLAGDMSLVGPRPEIPELVEQYNLWQRKRFAVPQGMTGWWQVNGRSDKPMHLHTDEDLYYVQHYSIWLDLQILFRTAWVVVRGKGAF